MSEQRLYRGKTVKTGVWVKGWYVYVVQPRHSEHEHCIFDIEKYAKGEDSFAFCFRYVQPASVGQYWGKDRDKQDIYVGDEVCPLVKRTDAMRGRVLYDEEIGSYRIDVGTEECLMVCPDDCKLLDNTDTPEVKKETDQ